MVDSHRDVEVFTTSVCLKALSFSFVIDCVCFFQPQARSLQCFCRLHHMTTHSRSKRWSIKSFYIQKPGCVGQPSQTHDWHEICSVKAASVHALPPDGAFCSYLMAFATVIQFTGIGTVACCVVTAATNATSAPVVDWLRSFYKSWKPPFGPSA